MSCSLLALFSSQSPTRLISNLLDFHGIQQVALVLLDFSELRKASCSCYGCLCFYSCSTVVTRGELRISNFLRRDHIVLVTNAAHRQQRGRGAAERESQEYECTPRLRKGSRMPGKAWVRVEIVWNYMRFHPNDLRPKKGDLMLLWTISASVVYPPASS